MGKPLELMHMDGCTVVRLLVPWIWSWTIPLGSMAFRLLHKAHDDQDAHFMTGTSISSSTESACFSFSE